MNRSDETTGANRGDIGGAVSGLRPQARVDLAAVQAIAQRMLADSRGSHAWDHTLRVLRLSERIGAVEGADMVVLHIAALLHDVGRDRQDTCRGRICHALEGARRAETLVRSLPLSAGRQENILHCIRAHRFRGNQAPATLEARVLFDADKLDAIGAVGVARAFLFAGEVGARLHNAAIDVAGAAPYSADDTGYREFKVKLCKIRERILTHTGRRLAAERHAFMEAFFERFIAEYEGER